MNSLLFIDDDIDLLEINKKYFTKKGYIVHTLDNLNELTTLLSLNSYDCILLDIMMPQMSGFNVLRQIRLIRNTPIIFISGKTAIEAKIQGLTIGGNDYVTKPFDYGELNARIQIQINNSISKNKKIEFPSMSIDLETHRVLIDKEELYLSNREFELLVLLAKNPHKTVTYEEICQTFWDEYNDQDKNSIMVTASRLRKKLSNYKQLRHPIESVRSVGYKFTL